MNEVRILFEDSHLIVISKPAGLLSQSDASGHESLVDWARVHFGRNYVGLVHRLDRNTSGLMVIAKRSKAALRLTESLKSGKLVRRYLAWVWGDVRQNGIWTHYLVKDEVKNRTAASVDQRPGSKKAVLEYSPLQFGVVRGSSVTLLEFTLETGRSHQIRAQALAHRTPLVGDPKYFLGQAPAASPFSRPALHSAFLSFDHPMSGEILEFYEDLPEDLVLEST